jgi:hypothetical protein
MGEINEHGMLENGYLWVNAGDRKVILSWVLWK